MKITIMVEGKTETAFKPHLLNFLKSRLDNQMPRLNIFKYDGRIPKGDKLGRAVQNLLRENDAVIALTDVYTGTNDFTDAADAKQKMRQWAGNHSAFYPHVALHDFEAWLLPYWSDIQRLAGHTRGAPVGSPETVDHNRPPSYHIREIFRVGTCRNHYSKARDANRILRDQDLTVAAGRCPELKAFLNTIIRLSGGTPL